MVQQAPPARKPEARVWRALKDECTKVAAPVRRARARRGEAPPPLPEMPSLDRLAEAEPAKRRLQALRAVDAHRRALDDRPRDPALHHRLGRLHLYALENPTAAAQHLCRAMLLEPESDIYRLEVLAGWMRQGQEQQLELALQPGWRSLDFKGARDAALQLEGLDERQQAEFFERSLRSRSRVRNSRLLPRRRVTRQVTEPLSLIRSWIEELPGQGRTGLVVSFPAKARGRVKDLLRRSQDSPAVWASAGPGRRWLLFAEGDDAPELVLSEAAERLRGVRVGISVTRPDRRLYLIGRFKGDGFRMTGLGMRPESEAIRQFLYGPPPEASDLAP